MEITRVLGFPPKGWFSKCTNHDRDPGVSKVARATGHCRADQVPNNKYPIYTYMYPIWQNQVYTVEIRALELKMGASRRKQGGRSAVLSHIFLKSGSD